MRAAGNTRIILSFLLRAVFLTAVFGLAVIPVVELIWLQVPFTNQFSFWIVYACLALPLVCLLWGRLIWQLRQQLNLNRLVAKMADIASSEHSDQIDWRPKSGRQIKTLVNSFNQIMAREADLRQEEQGVERSKDEMMTNISHDLRTPLTAIIGYLGLVVLPDQKVTPAEQKRYLKTAYDKSNQMKNLVEDLFEFSKTQAKSASLNITEFSLGDLFAQLLASYELEAQQKNIELTYLIQPKLIIMSGDSDKLARVLMNLISNALKYAEGASFVKITAQVRPDDQVEIRVTNDGRQIPQEATEDIFERFYRVESSRNNRTGGTGLGLAIVKGIVLQHHGRVWVESDEQVTSFVVVLPLQQPQEVSDERAK